MNPSKQLFLLRAFGDFLIAVHMVSKSSVSTTIKLVASKHLEPLYRALEPLLPAPVQIAFVDFKIDKQLMRCFTNKYLFHPQTLSELIALRHYLREEKIMGDLYLEQQKRIFFPRWFCNQAFRFVVADKPVYQSYADCFSVPLHTLENIPFGGQVKATKILVVPDSRQPIKVIDQEIIQQIQRSYNDVDTVVTVAFFREVWDAHTGNAVVYHNFEELIALIRETDLLIGGDSLPVHLAQFLGKPHYILYPGSKTENFFTPFALKHRTYFTFEDLKSRNAFPNYER